MTENKYFGQENSQLESAYGVRMALRSKIAYDLVSRYTFVTVRKENVEEGEQESAIFQSPQEIVKRAFGMADEFVRTAEERGELLSGMTMEEAAVRQGIVDALRSKASGVNDRYRSGKDEDHFQQFQTLVKNFGQPVEGLTGRIKETFFSTPTKTEE